MKFRIYEEALLDFSKVIEINPYSADTYYNKCKAIHYKKYNSIKINPDEIEAYNNRG